MSSRQGGFTLIELMIVVAIIGVLAAIAVPQYQSYVARSEAASGLASLRAYQTGVEERIVSANLPSPATDGTIGDALEGQLGIPGDSPISITITTQDGNNSAATGAATMTYSFQGGGGLSGQSLSLNRTEDGVWSCTTTLDDDLSPGDC
ncbi:pilin [Kushneria aurantia]|uniref:Pilin n=1 Tax=Kushneria aurantia TaxID=504092 RepID=A0ABV6FZX0_9GAMM|nr:pilin [Kushneria aurantia]